MRKHRIAAAALGAGMILACHAAAQAGGWETELRACRELTGQTGLDACNSVFVLMPKDLPPQLVSEVHRNRGIIYGQMGRKDEALHELKKAEDLFPGDAKTQYNLGVAYEEMSHDWLALRAYRKATKLDPEMTVAWANRAMAAYRTERAQEARVAFETVQEMEPSYFDTHEEHRLAWEEMMKVKPLSVAGRREMNLRLTPNLGVITMFNSSTLPLNQFMYLLLDGEFDVQIHRNFFGIASFSYARTTFKAPQSGNFNIYSPSFGVKIATLNKVSEPVLTFLDRSRIWFSGQFGPAFVRGNDSSGLVAVSNETSLSITAAAGFEYFFHPNIALGMQGKMNYVGYSVDNFIIFSVGPSFVGRF